MCERWTMRGLSWIYGEFFGLGCWSFSFSAMKAFAERRYGLSRLLGRGLVLFTLYR
jgi:hypothetical protein